MAVKAVRLFRLCPRELCCKTLLPRAYMFQRIVYALVVLIPRCFISCPVISDAEVFMMENGKDMSVKWNSKVFRFKNYTRVYLHCNIRLCFDGAFCRKVRNWSYTLQGLCPCLNTITIAVWIRMFWWCKILILSKP